jgi:predicted transcriptional regulator
MIQVSIALPDECRDKLQEIADRETFGNVTMLIRVALSKQYPELKPLIYSIRKKRGNDTARVRVGNHQP